MPIRHIYLKIEQIPNYSPVAPDPMPTPPRHYARDCMRNPGHLDTNIPISEVVTRSFTAIVYREYLDPNYLVPKPDKLVLADVNEPVYHRRVPGTVIYAHPGDQLKIHVLNADVEPHSLHMHGLRYGIDSDGSWPLGMQATDGRRSDEICPGQRWTYTFDVTDETIGVWPFHDHSRNLGPSINRGLFGGVIVLPREGHHLPGRIELPPQIEDFLKEVIDLPPMPIPPMPIPPMSTTPMGMGGMAMGGMAMPGMRAPAMGGMAMPGMRAPAMGGMAMPGMRAPAMAPMATAESPTRSVNMACVGTDKHHHPVGAIDAWVREAHVEFLGEWAQLEYVHPKPRPHDPLHVPMFLHFMSGSNGKPAFDSGPVAPGGAPYEVTFGAAATYSYHCNFHPMTGAVNVAVGGAALATVTIEDSPTPRFNPATVTVAPGGMVRWVHVGVQTHSVTEDAAGLPSYCLNGRSFVGNSPTIEAVAGQKICWYVFNLDVGMMWHNFHVHGQRWKHAGETIDTRSIGPAESFMVETTAPPVLLLPPDIAQQQEPSHRPKGAKEYHLRGEFLFHCHVEMHMMAGLTGIVRSRQSVWLTPQQAKQIAKTTGLPLDPGGNECADVDLDRCNSLNCGKWAEVVGNPEVTMMHAMLLPQTNKVLFWGYGDTRDDLSRLWDYTMPAGAFSMPANQPFDVTVPVHNRALANIWSAEHAHLADGKILVHGGFTPREAFLFDPATLSWVHANRTAQDRFYATTLTLADGKALTLFGSASRSIEVYDPAAGTWSAPIPLPSTFDYLYYPWTYLLPGGDLFIAGTGDHGGATGLSHRFSWSAPVDDPARTWATIAGNRSTGGEKATSVLLPLVPPAYAPRVIVAGGDTPSSEQTAEIIDLSLATPAWTALPNLHQARNNQVNCVLLPDGHLFLAGGVFGAGGPTEILDTKNPAAGWELCSTMKYSRGYHSSAILLADGSVLMGGDQAGAWKSGESTPHERYYPWYYFRARPAISSAPSDVAYGAAFTIHSPEAPTITEVVLLRPGAVTHGFNMSQRSIHCAVIATGASTIDATAPPDGNIAPPGWYLLFIVDAGRVPSVATWIRVH